MSWTIHLKSSSHFFLVVLLSIIAVHVEAQSSYEDSSIMIQSGTTTLDDCTEKIEQLQEDHKQKQELLLSDMSDISRTTQRFKLFSVLIVFFVLIFVSLLLYNAIKNKKLSKELVVEKTETIERQREQLKSRNYDLETGLRYARRIQEAVLPLEEDIRKEFEDAMVLFRPKNQVGGDFYWHARSGGFNIISVLDCTGHGIAGGYMALMGNDLLNQIIQDPTITDPAQALTYMNLKLVKSFAKINDAEKIIDGMEVGICAINEETLKMEYAGAYRHLYLIRNGNLEVVTGDTQEIGTDRGLRKQFTLQERQLQKGDLIFLHTDGFVNQFGGPDGKKFKYKRFQNLLLEIANLPLHEQRDQLNEAFEAWKGLGEQLDDICVVGIRI